MALRIRYPWNDVNRLQLVEVVREVKTAAKNHCLKWKEVARRLQNESSDMDESLFGRLCAKQFDNLYRAYIKYKQDGDQPPRLTSSVIDEFDELFPGVATGGKASEAYGIGGSVDTRSESPDAMTQEAVGKVSKKLSWTTATRLNLLTAVRGSSTREGKIHWTEVAARLSNDFGISEDRLCMLCMKQFSDLSLRYKDFKVAGSQPRRLTVEIIQMLEELFEAFPNLDPLPNGTQHEDGNDREDVSRVRVVNSPAASNHEIEQWFSPRQENSRVRAVNSPAASNHEIEHRSSSRQDDVPNVGVVPGRDASSGGKQDPSPDSERREGLDEPTPPRNEVAYLGKRKERAETSSSQTDTSSQEDYKDEQEAGFGRMDRELVLLQTWLKQEVLPVGREVLSRVKAHGRRLNKGKKRNKSESHDDFDKLIYKASQKSTLLAVRAQFQQARANILKEVKETIERVGMSLLKKRASAFQNGQGELPDHSQAGPSRSG